MAKTVMPKKQLECGKCGTKAWGSATHAGRKHQACGGRKKGSGTSREGGGTWK